MSEGTLLIKRSRFATTALAALASLAMLGGGVALDPVRGVSIDRRGMRHISLLVAAFLLVLAFGAWLQLPQLQGSLLNYPLKFQVWVLLHSSRPRTRSTSQRS